MNLKEARIFYKIIKDKFSINSHFENFFDYFEDTWLPLTDSDKTKFEFDKWNYKNKFNFKGNKSKLLKDYELSNYILFSNNTCKSFNHLINQYINSNTRINIIKFEEVLKFIFIRMESNNDSTNKKERMVEKTLISDILRGLIDAGYGVNNQLLKYTEIKDLLKDNKCEENILDNIFKVEDVADESSDVDEIIE